MLMRFYDVAIVQGAVFAGQRQADIAEPDRDTGGEQRVRTINHMKMQVRFCGVTGVAESGDGLASLDYVSSMNSQTSWQKMSVKGVFAGVMFQNDIVTSSAQGSFCQQLVLHRQYARLIGLGTFVCLLKVGVRL